MTVPDLVVENAFWIQIGAEFVGEVGRVIRVLAVALAFGAVALGAVRRKECLSLLRGVSGSLHRALFVFRGVGNRPALMLCGCHSGQRQGHRSGYGSATPVKSLSHQAPPPYRLVRAHPSKNRPVL